MQDKSEIERLEKTLVATVQAIGAAKNTLDSLSALAVTQLESILGEISNKFSYYEAEIERLRRENGGLKSGIDNLSELPRANMSS